MRNASRPLVCFLLVTAGSFVSLVAPAAAQQPDLFGVRAQGMAGALTAVADDATPSRWNPAGVAGGGGSNRLPGCPAPTIE